MTITRLDIRQGMLDADFVDGAYGTATAGSTTATLFDTTNLRIGGEPKAKWGRIWVHRPAANNAEDVIRRNTATGYTSLTGAVVHAGPVWTEAPLGGTDDGAYELWRWDPREVNRAIDRALTDRCWLLNKDEITSLTGASRYDVSAAPFSLTIESLERQVRDIEQVFGSAPNQVVNRWSERQAGGRFYIEQDAGVEYLFTDPPLTGTIRLIWISSFTALSTDAVTTTVELDYIVWAAWYELITSRIKRLKSRGEPTQELRLLAAMAFTEYDAMYKQELGRYAAHVYQRGSETTGTQAVAYPAMGGNSR